MPSACSLLESLRSAVAPLAGQSLLVAVSGGPDSVALLRGLCALQDDCRLTLTVAHYNHRFRGTASDADAAWVTELARHLQLGCEQAAAPVATSSVREADARESRYQFLQAAAAKIGATYVVTGHTRDDQAETVLHHIARGTGLRGLRGIPRSRTLGGVTLLRPLLDVRRADVIAFLADVGQDFRLDVTNADTTLTRNWLRHELLPVLEQRFPEATAALTRLADQADETAQLLEWLGRSLLKQARQDVGEPSAGEVRLNTEVLQQYPVAAIRSAFVELWIEQGWPRLEMTFSHWDHLARLAATPTGGCSLPGPIDARKHRNILVLRDLRDPKQR